MTLTEEEKLKVVSRVVNHTAALNWLPPYGWARPAWSTLSGVAYDLFMHGVRDIVIEAYRTFDAVCGVKS